jgi:hypothetical protein
VHVSDIPSSIVEIGSSKFTKTLIYANWGAGKTVFIGSGGRQTLILRAPTDHTDSILNFYPPELRPREWIVHDWDEMEQVHQYLRLNGSDWENVWLDSISAWQDTGLDDIWAAVLERRPDRNQLHAGKDKGEYGRNMDRLGEWVRNVVSLDTFNFGITAWPTTKLDAPNGERKMMPWVQGSMMSEKICGYMNQVGFMDVKRSPSSGRVYRVIDFNETDDFYAKDQFDAFPNGRLVDPTLPKLLEAVEAKKGNVPRQSGKKKRS